MSADPIPQRITALGEWFHNRVPFVQDNLINTAIDQRLEHAHVGALHAAVTDGAG